MDLKTKQCLPPTFKLIQSIMYLYIALDFRITNIIEIGTYGNIVNLELLILISKLTVTSKFEDKCLIPEFKFIPAGYDHHKVSKWNLINP